MFILYVYNAVSIPLRASFPFTQGTNFIPIGTLRGPPEVQWVGLLVMWILLDLLADTLYVLDIILIQSHLTPQELGEINNHNQVSVNRAILVHIAYTMMFQIKTWRPKTYINMIYIDAVRMTGNSLLFYCLS